MKYALRAWYTKRVSYEQAERALAALLEKAGVRYFSARELLTLGPSHYTRASGAYGTNTLPPEGLLHNIIPAALALDSARNALGTPVLVNSAFRSETYNSRVGGEPSSFHREFKAIDATTADPGKVADLYRTLRDHRHGGMWSGGLGGYHTFVHVDTGTTRNRDWGIQH